MKVKLFLFFILVLAFALRFYRLNDVPSGFHQDEISQSYNSFSILKTGKDRYGQSLPILFRSFGSYQPPVYTYLTPISLVLFGNTIFAARLMSAVFGVLTVLLTYLIVKLLAKEKYLTSLSILSSFIVAISPWAIHFSRRVVEGNLGLFFFLLSLYFFIRSLKKINYLIPASIILGLSTHAYYSERLIAVIFLPFYLYYYKDYFLKYRKQVILGVSLFGLTLLPHLITVYTGAFAARLDQVGTAGIGLSFFVEFIKHFIGYFSPLYLFSDAGSGLARVSPDLGIFYSWFLIPFLAGLYFISRFIINKFLKFLAILTVIFLVPASLTGDIFYPLRALEFFWILSLIVSVGILAIGEKFKPSFIRYVTFLVLVMYSLGHFYVSYFILFQHETTENVGNTYLILSNKLKEFHDYKIVIDSTRDPATGLRIAFFRSYDPTKIQLQLKDQMETPYYSKVVNNNEMYTVDNIEARPINWNKDRCSHDTILIGDSLAISGDQKKEHNLTKAFEIEGLNKEIVLFGYFTNPDLKCNLTQ